MARDYTATGLVAAIQRKAFLPSNPEGLSAVDFYALMDEEIATNLVPMIMSAKEEYYATTLTPDLTLVSGQDTYPLPYRSMGGKLRLVQIALTSAGSNQNFVPLARVEPERSYNYAISGSADGYMLEGDNLVLVPPGTMAGLLRIKYFMRPNQVVDSSACAQITSVASNSVTCSGGLPTAFITGAQYDLIKGTPGFNTMSFDQTGTVSSNTVTFSALPTLNLGQGGSVAVGDWLCLAGQTPIPQIPYDMFAYLSQCVVCSALQAAGDRTNLPAAEAKRDGLRVTLLTLLQPRTEGSNRVIVNQYGPGFARIGRFRRR